MNNIFNYFDQMGGLEFSEILNKNMKKIFDSLGGGFKESVYQHALAIELRKLGFIIQKEVNKEVLYLGEEVGIVRIDMLVDKMYIIEFKAISKITEKEINQVKRYLNLFRNDGIISGFIINVKLDRYEVITVQ